MFKRAYNWFFGHRKKLERDTLVSLEEKKNGHYIVPSGAYHFKIEEWREGNILAGPLFFPNRMEQYKYLMRTYKTVCEAEQAIDKELERREEIRQYCEKVKIHKEKNPPRKYPSEFI